ncbi:ACT domain-containing protein [Gaoshiqia sp. Z1-71]|uniref:ACT domain-containing protein n=1 Tax=Gaoshiqia hydrogeniformans TaxID=3290090 RepID=UPI003BF7A914
MPDCIVRFGGNNLNDPQVILSLVQLLKQAKTTHILTISATNEIQSALTKGLQTLGAAAGDPDLILALVHNETEKVKNQFGLSALPSLTPLLEKLDILLKGIHYTGDFSLALQDQVLSFAEKITAALLLGILQQNDIEAGLVFPETLGLLVSEEYGNATVLIEQSRPQVSAFRFGKVNIIPGSYGLTQQGRVARIGRRAADYTAASVASILNLKRLELWQISTPFKTADDQFVENPAYIDSLTYAEASELAYFNYSGIHPRIVEPLMEKHIPIYVYELAGGEKVLRTIINSKNTVTPQVVKSVAYTDDIAILKLNGPGVGFKPGILAKVTTAFNNQHINIRSVITAQTCINIMVDKASIERARQLSRELDLPSVSRVEIAEQVSLIAIVGHGMQENHGISAALFSAVAKNRINVLISGSGASDLVSYLVVDKHDKIKAIQEIHKIFFHN